MYIGIILIIIISSIVLSGAVILGLGFLMYKSITAVMKKKLVLRHTEEFLHSGGFNLSAFFKKYGQFAQQLSISSRHGHIISADYFKINKSAAHDTVVLIHGIGNDRRSMYPLTAMFLENGYNVLVYDQRGTGRNTAKTVTFGYYESDDLEDCLKFLTREAGARIHLGVLGQSMGAATAAFYTGKSSAEKYLDFVILDSPFSGMADMVKWTIGNFHIPVSCRFAAFCGNINTRIMLGFSYSDMDILKAVSKSSLPFLFIHSRSDIVCPYYMSSLIYDSILHDQKEILTLEGCPHIKGFFEYPEEYADCVFSFIKNKAKNVL